MYSIRQTATGWEVLDASGAVVLSGLRDYPAALAGLGGLLDSLTALAAAAPADPAAPAPEVGAVPVGALPFRWRSGENGSALLGPTGPHRDFTGCVFTFRETPALPLMLATRTDVEHYGAELAGWSDDNQLPGGVPTSEGWLHDNESGRELLRILVAQGRIGVSLDPGEYVDAEWECTELDDDGFCTDDRIVFTAYEIAGQTALPVQGFSDAYIELVDRDTAAAWLASGGTGDPVPVVAPAPVAAAGGRRDPRPDYLTAVPPALDDPAWVHQRVSGLPAIPLDIAEPDADGFRHVSGFAAGAGVCHIAYPDECLTYQPSPTAYSNFHLHVRDTSDGARHAVGTLVFGRDHAPLAGLSFSEARDNYAHTGLAWADVHVTDIYAPDGAVWQGRPIGGTYLGAWVTGVVRSNVNADVVSVLRASGLSVDLRWDQVLPELDLVGLQSVNVPGWPVARQAIAASGLDIAEARMQVRRAAGRIVAARGIGMVERHPEELSALAAAGTIHCSTCPEPTSQSPLGSWSLSSRMRRRPTAARAAAVPAADPRIDELARMIGVIERRTRHLIPAEAQHTRQQLDR